MTELPLLSIPDENEPAETTLPDVILPDEAVSDAPALTDAGQPAETTLPDVILPDEAVSDEPAPKEDAPATGLILPADALPAASQEADAVSFLPLLPTDAAETGALTESGFRCTFAGEECRSPLELAQAMADSWDQARSALVTGSLAEQLDAIDLLSAAICRDQTANIASGRFTPDRAVLEAIQRLSGLPMVVWCGRRYADAIDLGGSLLQALRGTGAIPVHCDSLLMSGAASVFADPAQRSGLQAIEARYAAPGSSLREKTLLMYVVGYMLCGVAAYVLEGESFYTVEQLSAWLEARCKRSSAAFTHACHRLLDENHLLDPQLEAWLTALGRHQDVMRWQAEIDAGML